MSAERSRVDVKRDVSAQRQSHTMAFGDPLPLPHHQMTSQHSPVAAWHIDACDTVVAALLADPEHAEIIQRKLEALKVAATVEFRGDGYVCITLDPRRRRTV